MTGAKLVLPGPRLDAASLLGLIAAERVTITAGVPTVFLPLLEALDANPGAYDVSSLHTMVIGGSAAPQGLIEAFQRRHGISVLHAWGMSELAPIGTIGRLPAALAAASDADRFTYRARQGRPVAFVEVRARGDDGLVPWDGATYGELEVRGASVSSAYLGGDGADSFTADGWFRTGDIVTIDGDGTVTIQDRAKDLIKSGGEWISSVALENALMGHPAVGEAAVVAVPHERWGERPLAVVVLREGATVTAGELRAHLSAGFARWWLPDEFVFAPSIPKSATGKFKKTALRDIYRPS
jgi:fatty-acyl-CoA synthase